MPTKIDVHACYIDAYLHEFFEPILLGFIFDPFITKDTFVMQMINDLLSFPLCSLPLLYTEFTQGSW